MALDKLLYLRGIGLKYTNYHGEEMTISEHDRQAVLTCMLGRDGMSADSIDAQNYHIDAEPWLQPLVDFQWCYCDELALDIRVPASLRTKLVLTITNGNDQSFSLDIVLNDVTQREQLTCIGDYYINGQCYLNYRLAILPHCDPKIAEALTLGYYQLSLTLPLDAVYVSAKKVEAQQQKEDFVTYIGTLMVAPRQAYQRPLSAQSSQKQVNKVWGISAQLYSVNSEHQWGIGDFADLQRLIKLFAAKGASFIQLNPLHALNNHDCDDVSPYSPSDRRRLNPLYLDIASLAEYQYEAAEFELPCWQAERSRLNSLEWIDYNKVYQLKFCGLALLYEAFCKHHLYPQTARAKQCQEFVNHAGSSLLGYALFEAQKGLAKGRKLVGIPIINARAIAAYHRVVAKQDFYLYLQFVTQQQLSLCQQLAGEEGMSIGLIRDLAVGAKADGYEVQENQEVFCASASIGAPPDDFSAAGQDWGLPPFDPVAMVDEGFVHFISLVRSNLQSCGALRIDHVMGLYRLWWWSQSQNQDSLKGKAGAYVHYPVETLMAIICLESHQAQSLLIGEDLGLVPEPIKHQLDKSGIFSNELFYFCRHFDKFYSPADFKAQSLLMLANHDVPPLAAWWLAQDIVKAASLGLYASDDEMDKVIHQRNLDKTKLVQQFVAAGEFTDLPQFELIDVGLAGLDDAQLNQLIQALPLERVLSAWIKITASANSTLFCIQLCDLGLDTQAVNIPGTWKEYPNWQRRMPMTITEIMEQEWLQATLIEVDKARSELGR